MQFVSLKLNKFIQFFRWAFRTASRDDDSFFCWLFLCNNFSRLLKKLIIFSFRRFPLWTCFLCNFNFGPELPCDQLCAPFVAAAVATLKRPASPYKTNNAEITILLMLFFKFAFYWPYTSYLNLYDYFH